jgi:hypothetical protein
VGNNTRPWVQNRGLGRLLTQETTVSDIIQLLSDRDSSPWEGVVGFVPDDVTREASKSNRADLLLSAGDRRAVIEVKLGHIMSAEQQGKYEALQPRPDLYLAALDADRHRVGGEAPRWTFISLADLLGRWSETADPLARSLAIEAAAAVSAWDRSISGVFAARGASDRLPIRVLDQKFLARVATRRIAEDLRSRGRYAGDGVTAGGGIPLVVGWTPIRGEGKDRTFMAEVRWWETKSGGELRFGVDFDPRPGEQEDEEVRRAAYDLATSMADSLDAASIRAHFDAHHPELAPLLSRTRSSRPEPRGEWEPVIVHGFAGVPLADGKRNNRNRTRPAFYGDGTLRFQAIAEIDFAEASAADLTDLLDGTLSYLAARQP